MPLSKGTTYDNLAYDYILNPMKNIFKDEFPSSSVYISERLNNAGNFEIKLWSSISTTEDLRNQAFSKRYNVTVDVYIREANPNEAFYELLYARAERAYQLLFNNQSKSTTVGGVTHNWVAGETSDVVLNEFSDEESEIDGLNKISLDFSCLIER